MSALAVAPAEEADDERIAIVVRFHGYADETHAHLVRIAEMLADGDQELLKDLLLIVKFLWG